ncbi:MAG: NAD(P)-dependent oxidoreductase, partial [Chloroflexi bacterium]|nr:NAD(P)-dependent oxidoreductase [Chloroflexota bacterium]
MNKRHIGFLHPGAMGVSVAMTAQNTGHVVYWVANGRSRETHERAEAHNLTALQSIEELCHRCDVIVCVCPPHAATEVAQQFLSYSFNGIYADVNAISPQRVKHIGQLMDDAGVAFVDGGIIGGPAWKPNST